MENLKFINTIKSYKKDVNSEIILIFINGYEGIITAKRNNLSEYLNSIVEDFDFNVKNKYPDIYKKLWTGDKFIYLDEFSEELFKFSFVPVDVRLKYAHENPMNILKSFKINRNKFQNNFNCRNIFSGQNVNFYVNIGKIITIKNDRKEEFMKIYHFIKNIQINSLDKDYFKNISNSFYETLFILRKDIFKDVLIHHLTSDNTINYLTFVRSIFENMILYENKISHFLDIDYELLFDLDMIKNISSLISHLNDVSIIPIFSDNYCLVKYTKKTASEGNCYPISFDIEKDIKTIINKDIYDIIDWNETYVSGGLLAKLINCYCRNTNTLYMENSDIDLFITFNDSNYINYLNNFKRISKSWTNENNNYYFVINDVKVNTILIKKERLINAISDFHFCCAKALYNPKIGLKMFMSCIVSNITNIIYTFCKGKISDEIFMKYSKRGYSFILNKNEVSKLGSDYEIFEMTRK